MPANLDYALYFNIVFFSLIGFGFLVGYFRGFKKSLWSLLVVLIFYGLFFLTIDTVINQIWTAPVGSLIQQGASFMPELANANTIGEAVFTALETYVGPQLGDTLSNENFIELITGLSQFALKLVYMIVYFSVGRVLYTIIMFILRIILIGDVNKVKFSRKEMKAKKAREKQHKMEFKKMNGKERRAYKKLQKKYKKKGLDEDGNKKKKVNKRPLVGALLGAAKGTVSAFMTLIMLGGVMSMTESMLKVIPDNTSADVNQIEYIYLSNDYSPTDSMLGFEPEMAAPTDLPSVVEDQLQQGRDMVAGFNNNMFVTYASQLLVTNENYSEPVPLNLYLFDSVLSFNYGEQNVRIRNEIEILSDVGAIFLNSEFSESASLNDIDSEDIVDMFDAIANSDFITSMIPLGIEVGSEYLETDIEIPVEDLYAIDWKAEISTLGAIVAVGFDLVNTAGILDDETDLTTVTLEGSDVRELFDALSDSELATLGAYIAMEPLLANMGQSVEAIVTVPDDMEWSDEFAAFGLVAEAILDTGISVGDLQSADPTLIISAMSELDFTVLLNSTIVSHALKNIFDGTAGIEGMELIVVPDGVVWFDTYDVNGDLETAGELRNILLAVNSITDVADGFDFENINLNVIADFEDETIDSLFNSVVLVATISGFILDMDLGDTPLVIPDSVLDANGYITSVELKAVATSAKVLVSDLACDEGDTACEATGFDIAKALTLSDTSIDTLTTSDILGATMGNVIIDMGGDILTVPNSAMTSVSVNQVPQDVVSKDEIKKLFQAVSVLGFTDLETMTFDASIIQNLGIVGDETTLDTAKSGKLFGSKIVHATLSDMLFEQTEGAESVLAVPYFAEDLTPVRIYDATDDIEYLSTTELDNILQALLTLDISDFAAVDSLDLDLIISNSDELLDSSILHATISKQVFDLGGEIISVPYKNELDEDVRVTVGSAIDSTETEYIVKDEITGVLDALEILGITDINSFDGTVDLASITSDPTNIDTMLDSAIIHATISDQLIQLDVDGTLSIPYVEEDDLTPVRVTVGTVGFETEYIVKEEIKAMVDSLDLLGVTDMESFSGTVGFDVLTEGTNLQTILSSSTIQATISKQVLDLGGDVLVVPYFEEDDLTEVRVTVGTVGFETEYIKVSEIEAMVNGLDILGITDVESFDGSISLTEFYDETNRNLLLSSAIMQATISDQLIDLGDGTLRVPTQDADSQDVRVVVGNVGLLTDTEYVTKAEISAMFEALEVLGITDITSFSGTIDLNTIYGSTNQDIILSSASLHATITKQMKDLGPATLNIPDTDVNGVSIQTTVSGTEYIEKVEIKAMINALEVLGVDDINNFSGSFDISALATEPAQDTLLSSASIHSTIGNTLLDLDDAVLIVPMYTQVGETGGNEIRITVSGTEFVVKDEIKALINSFTTMGFTDLDSFGASLNSTEFFNGRDTLLLSSSIQATLSNKMLNDTGGALVVPDTNVNTASAVRIIQTDVTYIDVVEIDAILDALEELGLTDFSSMDFSPANVFTVDFNLLFTSASIQATVSENILPNTVDETAPYGSTTLVVPTYFREDILVATVSEKQISKTELIALLDSLDALGVTDFGGGMDATTITNMGDAELDTFLASGSVHTTIDNMLKGNANISGLIPALAEEDTLYQTDIITQVEIKAFIKATQLISSGSITTVSIDLPTIAALSPADQAIVADSMIIRNAITGPLETIVAADPFNLYVIANADYENSDPAEFFTKTAVLAIIGTYY